MAYVIVNGEVVSTFWDNKGVRIKEAFTKRDGSEGAAYYTAFFTEPTDLSEGDSGVFKGNLSVTLEEYEKDGELRHSAKATINNTKIEEQVYASDALAPPVVETTASGAIGFG